MKKISMVLFTFLIVACSSSNDDSTDSSQDLIIGKWTPDKIVYLLDSQIVETVPQTTCDALTSYEFMENNNINLISWISDSRDGCEKETAEFEYYNWTKSKGDEYKFTSKHPDESESINIELVKFESNNIMFWYDFYEKTSGSDYNERRVFFVKN